MPEQVLHRMEQDYTHRSGLHTDPGNLRPNYSDQRREGPYDPSALSLHL